MRILSRGSRELSGHLIPRCNRARRMRASFSLPTLTLPPLRRSAPEWLGLVPVSAQYLGAFRIACIASSEGSGRAATDTPNILSKMTPERERERERERLDAVYPLWKIQWTLPVFENEFPAGWRTTRFSNGRTSKLPRIVKNLWSFEVSACLWLRPWRHHIFVWSYLMERCDAVNVKSKIWIPWEISIWMRMEKSLGIATVVFWFIWRKANF